MLITQFWTAFTTARSPLSDPYEESAPLLMILFKRYSFQEFKRSFDQLRD